ncbi:MAG: L,D-transpeptidase family protein [Ilumatobacteraceae bacterium]
MPVLAAGGLLAAVIGVGIVSGGDDDTAPVPTGSGQVTPVATFDTGVPETVTADDQVVIGNAPVVKVPIGRTLDDGIVGDDVALVQQRLADLAFDPGPIDGIFGSLTQQAVWAFEKLVLGVPRADATGRVTPEIWDRMQDPITIQPRRPTGGLADHTEIYLPEQVMIVFHADRPALIVHVSTGELIEGATSFTPWWETAAEYCETVVIDTDDNGVPLEEPIEKAICGRSYTPPGVFQAYKKIEGRRESRLGGMYDPIYINQGIAIHGALNVPLEPASHGCIRVSQYIGSFLQSLLDIGDRVLIWDGETEPEEQSEEAMRMRWDYPDPNPSTTTSSTTTTTSTVPSAPATTVATPPTATTTTTTTSTTTTTTTTTPPE